MSEYSFYEFRTVNRTLTREEQKEVSTWSSRSDATPTGAKFIYNYGEFKHDPEKCLVKYFDMYLHYCNYGVRQIMFRFPKDLVNFRELIKYERSFLEYEYEISVQQKGEYIVISIEENDQSGDGFDWIECEDTLGAITSLWTDIVGGNYAALYAIWMRFAALTMDELDNEDDEDDYDDDDYDEDDELISQPPIPAGMQKITGALREFATFWGISHDFLTALGTSSAPREEVKIDYKKAIALLSDAEKSAFLLKLIEDEPQLQMQLIKKLEALSGIKPAQSQQSDVTIKDILALETQAKTNRIAAEKAAADAIRLKEIKAMVGKERQMWASVHDDIAQQKATPYDDAVKTLIDLRDLSNYTNTGYIFKANLEVIKEKYGRSQALLKRFVKNGL